MKPGTIYHFVQELKRRRVFRGIVVYGASTLVIYEAASNLYQTFGYDAAPEWIVYILAAGFFVSLWFSWIYDITPGGIRKTEPVSEKPVPIPPKEVTLYKSTTFISILVIVGILTYWLIDGKIEKEIAGIEKSIAVLPLPYTEAFRTESSLEHNFIGDQITTCLRKVKEYRVLPWEDSRRYHRKENASSYEMGRDLSVAILVDWMPYEMRGEKYIAVTLVAAYESKQLWSEIFQIDGNWSSEICQHSSRITREITRKLRIHPTPKVKSSINEQPKFPRASMYASLGSAITSDSWDLANTGKGAFDSLRSEYIDSISFERAIYYFTEAIKEDPEMAVAYANRAKARLWGMREGYFDQRVLADCETDISKAFELDPDLPEAHVAMGFYQFYGNDEYKLAAVSFEKAVDLAPDNPEYLFYLSIIWRRLGNWDRVQTLTDGVFEANPRNAVFQTNLGLSYLYLRNYARSVECQDRAIDLIPNWLPPHLNKINALMWEGRISEARKAVREAQRLTGKKFYRDAALLDLYEGQYMGAVENIEKAREIEFSDNYDSEGDVYLMKAEIHRKAGHEKPANEYYEKAQDYFQNLVLFDPDNYRAYSQLGLACAGEDMFEEAIEHGRKALHLIAMEDDAITYPYIHYHMIRIYALARQDASASSMIREHLNIPSPFSFEFLKLDPDLRHLLEDPGSYMY